MEGGEGGWWRGVRVNRCYADTTFCVKQYKALSYTKFKIISSIVDAKMVLKRYRYNPIADIVPSYMRLMIGIYYLIN